MNLRLAIDTARRIEQALLDADEHGILTERTRAAVRVFVEPDIEAVFAEAKRAYESNQKTIARCAAKKEKQRDAARNTAVQRPLGRRGRAQPAPAKAEQTRSVSGARGVRSVSKGKRRSADPAYDEQA
jgi:hypothetical protein